MRAALITGASSGIGRAAAVRLAQKGYGVGLVGRRPEALEKMAAEIRSAGGLARVLPADVSDERQMDAVVRAAHAEFGRMDVLVNCAGYAPLVRLAGLATKEWRKILDTNLSSAFYATRAVWPVMERQFTDDGTGGVIVNISSMSSKDPFMGLGTYGVAKAGLNMLTLATAREGANVGIRAVGIAPGSVDTPMFRGLMGDAPIEPGSVLAPEDVAAMIADITDGSLRHCSGETLFIHRGPA
jgi:NAD(P)-dependent dehydrogenase (short-subunit alcohol dehydrogenase family)